MSVSYSKSIDEGYLMELCGKLGSSDEDEHGRSVYVKHDQCSESLQDIMRFLRRDNPETRDVFMLLANWNLVKTDLLPIIRTYHDDSELVIAATKLVVFLTLPVDPTSSNVVDQQRVLQLMKSAFLDGETSTVIVSMIAEPLSRFEEDGRMDETDTKIVQLILTLFRNLLCIPDSLHSNASAGDHMTRLKDDLVQRFFTESVMEVILLIAQDANREPFIQDSALILEIMHEVFKGQSPQLLADVDKPHSHPGSKGAPKTEDVDLGGDNPFADLSQDIPFAEEHEDSSPANKGRTTPAKGVKKEARGDPALAALFAKEKAFKNRNPCPTRHSRFGGVYARQASDGGQTTMHRNPLMSSEELEARKISRNGSYARVCFGRSKPQLLSANKLAVGEKMTLSSTKVRKHLKELLDQFLTGPYNKLMGQVAADVQMERNRGLSASEMK
eukprot:CAMPEP_0198222400 /NCGR_PEP_ID=MMETSP1445-20131203/87918_1 /TAXON_ID=36898 /ORGANISM="Pyramimonas sp., Strain CCMP2087" /LENGTH=442 /DNA_ID=CAMNT_0043900897 /DNA_START=179 /DNA_END=1504 /DNA_ORIENTATION=+